MENRSLLIFVRNPEIGKVKSRLANSIGKEKALSIYVGLLKHTKSITDKVSASKYIFYSDFILEDDLWSGFGSGKLLQVGTDLGDRMNNAFKSTFMNSRQKIIIIGSDCPELNAEIIEDAFLKLDDHDIVIGPALDGGYYLLGMNAYYNLFSDISWSTNLVFSQTVEKVKAIGLKMGLLPVLLDIDQENDISLFKMRNPEHNLNFLFI